MKIKKIVLTSSTAAIMSFDISKTFTENDWSNP